MGAFEMLGVLGGKVRGGGGTTAMLAESSVVRSDGSAAAERTFLSWTASCVGASPDEAGDPRLSVGLGHLLGRVVTSPRLLPEDAAVALAVPPRTTIGEAAAWLLWAVHDPTGPRCGSYRSSVAYLRQRAGAPPAVRASAGWRAPR